MYINICLCVRIRFSEIPKFNNMYSIYNLWPCTLSRRKHRQEEKTRSQSLGAHLLLRTDKLQQQID